MIKYDKIIISPKDVVKMQQIAIKYSGVQSEILGSDEFTALVYRIVAQSNVTFNDQLITQEAVESDLDLALQFADLVTAVMKEYIEILNSKKKINS